MNIAILDDEKISCMQLQALVKRYATDHNLEITIESYTEPESFLSHFEAGRYTIIFLDIYMGDISGLDVAESIRKIEPDAMIIFCTTSVDSMPQAFRFHAFDYVVKPAKPDRINQLLDDATNVLPTVERYITLSVNRQKVNLKYSDIAVASTSGHYLDITDGSGNVYTSRMTLSQLLEQLQDDGRFLSINKGIIVNMDYIRAIEDGICILQDNSQYPVKIRELTQINQAISDYRFSKE